LSKTLDKQKVHAAFFINGKELREKQNKKILRRSQKLLKKLAKKKHVIGIVQWNEHVLWKNLNSKEVLKNVERSATTVSKVLGVRPNLIHPPQGKATRSALRHLGKKGYYVLGFGTTLDNGAKNLPTYKGRHDPKKYSYIAYQHADKDTVKEEKAIIKTVLKKDYDIVDVKKCLKLKPYRLVDLNNNEDDDDE
jgi:peptidoglycan/xylan/chitin deacetylase (PgdA/CDA1 family)